MIINRLWFTLNMLLDVGNEDDVLDLVGIAYTSGLINSHEPLIPTEGLNGKITESPWKKDLLQLYSSGKVRSFYEVGDILTTNQLALLFLNDMFYDSDTRTSLDAKTEQISELMEFFGTTSRVLELGLVAFVLNHYCTERLLKYDPLKNIYQLLAVPSETEETPSS